ncbi:hypothetical protein [Streptomyces chartreusis]|uniref:hypothetical protein n=1 Tax=Streptomyces chartreusis TaxID=1969 RepID=UPI003653278A
MAVYFGGSAWDTGDSRRAKSARRTREQLGEELQARAAELAERGITAHVCILDASLDADELAEKG